MMDQEMSDASYPDPHRPSFITPYPHGYNASGSHVFGAEEHLYPPMPQPLVHEGYIPRDGYDSDGDEDPDDAYSALRAQFNMDFVLNPHSAAPGAQMQGASEDDHDVDDEEERGFEHHSAAVRDWDRNAKVNSEFDSGEDDSDDDMSITSDVLDDILADDGKADRGRGRGGGRGARGRRGWKWALKGTEHDPVLAKRGRGRPRGRGNNVPRGEGRRKVDRTGGMKAAEPSAEFKRLQALATTNFLNQDLEAAADNAREAVKSNPEIFAAHSLLSEILLAQGKERDSLTVLLAGAHTKRDADLWYTVAQKTLKLAGEKRAKLDIEQAIYCFTWAIKLEPTDYDSRREKLNLLLELGELPRARKECKMMVNARPYDLGIIKQYADLCTQSAHPGEIQRARIAYERAIDFYSKGRSLGLPDTQWSHLNIYIDLFQDGETVNNAMKRLKELSRWLLGRKEDSWWNEIEDDDREFDMDDEPRRIQVPQFGLSKFQDRPEMYGAGLPLELRVKMGIYRTRMGRMQLPEAMRHFQLLLELSHEIDDYCDLFRDAAEALHAQAYYSEAVQFYEPIRSVPEDWDNGFYMHLAESYLALARKSEAEECYKYIVDNDAEDVDSRVALAKFYESETRMPEAIALIHEVMSLGRSDAVRKARLHADKPQRSKARKMAAEADVPDGASDDGSVFEDEEEDEEDEEEDGDNEEEENDDDEIGKPILIQKKKKKPQQGRPARPSARPRMNETYLGMKEQAHRIKSNHLLLRSAKEAADDGDEQALEKWMNAANSMLEDFRTMKVFYPGRDKHVKFTGYTKNTKSALQNEMEAMKKRLENDNDDNGTEGPLEEDEAVPKEFHDIRFEEWLDIFCTYALQLAKAGDHTRCYDTLQAAFYAMVFYHDAASKIQIHSTWLACALVLNDEQTLCNAARWFISEYSHSSTTYQLFAAVNRLYAGSSNWFNSGPTQKFILRSLKGLDYALLDPDGRAHYAFTGVERSSYTHGGKRDANPHNLEDLDPAVLALYGHIMAAAQSWTSALNYYLRVFVLLPEDATINLCIALSYIQMGMKRQSVNRHWQVYQGLAFLDRYTDIRRRESSSGDGGQEEGTKEAVVLQEVEYNRGRVFHLLGLTHLAVPAYERCLELAEEMERDKATAGARTGGRTDHGGEEVREEMGEEEEQEREQEEEEARAEQEEFTQEAAFALAAVFNLADNHVAARAVTKRWLVM